MAIDYKCPSCKKQIALAGDKPYRAAVLCPSCCRHMHPVLPKKATKRNG